MGVLEEIETAVGTVAERVGPSVVGVGQRWGMGSGVVLESGKVLTNAHNLRREEVTVTFADGRAATATAAGVDLDGDLAVLEVDTGDAPPIAWSEDGFEGGIGTSVFGVANPGGRGLRVTFGTISGTQRSFRGPRGRRIAGSIEHTAPLLPGSSGGPVVNVSGRLLGINTNRLGEGFYLAIPADSSLRARIEALSRGEEPARPHLGVGVAPARVARRLRRAVGLPEADGALVRQVEEGGPADSAGIREGDLIVEVGGRSVDGVDALLEAIEGHGSDSPLAIKLLRGSEERTVEVQPSTGGAR